MRTPIHPNPDAVALRSPWVMQKRIIKLYPLFLLGALLGTAKMLAEQIFLTSALQVTAA